MLRPALMTVTALLITGITTATTTTPAAAAPTTAAPTSLTTLVTSQVTRQVTTSTGKALLAKLTVKAESHNSTYDRAKFKHWVDADGDGCDTRNEVLIKESTTPATISTHCNVTAGKWVSWYDDKTWTDDADVDIDHVVALGEAWSSGAWDWTNAKRQRYANDLGYAWTLDAVTDNLNQSKGSDDPAEWLPPKHTCKYARHWVAIKYRWKLTINTAEKIKLASILTGDCGSADLTVPKRAT